MYTEKVGGAMGHRMGSLTLSVGVGNDAFLKPNSHPALCLGPDLPNLASQLLSQGYSTRNSKMYVTAVSKLLI
jgi:hypothetical protein